MTGATTNRRLKPLPARQATGAPTTIKFNNAEAAWIWTMACLMARRDGARSSSDRRLVSRPCDPDDVVKCLDGLYRQRRIDLLHARILRVWGERQTAPNPAYASEKADWQIWQEALGRLEWPLRVKGIVG